MWGSRAAYHSSSASISDNTASNKTGSKTAYQKSTTPVFWLAEIVVGHNTAKMSELSDCPRICRYTGQGHLQGKWVKLSERGYHCALSNKMDELKIDFCLSNLGAPVEIHLASLDLSNLFH